MTQPTQRLHLHDDDAMLQELRRTLRGHPAPLARPLAVIGGWRSPPMMANVLARRICELTTGHRGDVFAMSYAMAGSIERAAALLRSKLIPSLRARGAQELDVVAISMGGLVARHLASAEAWENAAERFRIRRLFTIATPHQGVSLARWFKVDRAARSMAPGSTMLASLDRCLIDANEHADELTCYVQRQDWYIGTWNAAPAGRELRWVHPRTLVGTCMSHFTAHQHPAIVTDIALRLRGDVPLNTQQSDG